MLTAPQLTVRFRGVRGSVPTPTRENMGYGGNTSCVEVRSGKQLLIFDAGTGIRSLSADLLRVADGNPIEATLLLSHSHWDHIQGLPFFAPGYSPENRIRILGAPGRGPQLQSALVNQMTRQHFPVGLEQMHGLSEVEELVEGVAALGDFRIHTIQLNHPGGCTGFRIETAAGSLGYLPDHEPYRMENGKTPANASGHHSLVEFIRDMDVMILDTQYTAEEYAHKIGWGHGCLSDSVRLAIEANVRGLMFFHHDPLHNDQRIDEMVKLGQTFAAGSDLKIEAAHENGTLSLGSSAAGVAADQRFRSKNRKSEPIGKPAMVTVES